jgi:cobalt/nickel transport system permease protein
MHIPDGFIDGKTAAAAAALSAVGVGWALRRVKQELPPRQVPLLGLAAAFLFAAQLVNFPVAGGTSGHLIGGVLVAALLGPSAAIVVVTTVLIVQCFLFADGGVLALGANIFNMGIVGAGGGCLIYRIVCRARSGIRGRVTAIVFAGWCSTVLAAIGCAGQLAWSGTVTWSAGFTAMASVHMLIGIGEGLISALAFLAIARTRPDLVRDLTADSSGCGQGTPKALECSSGRLASTLAPPEWPVGSRLRPALPGLRPNKPLASPDNAGDAAKSTSRGGIVSYGLLAALGVAVFVAPFACPWPDGLEAVAGKLGFEHKAAPALSLAAAPDYRAPGVPWAAGATALAGAAGTLVVFGLALLLGQWLVPKPAKGEA